MEESSDDEVATHERSWAKLKNSMFSQGYREGISDGKESRLQDGFDAGYTLGFVQSQPLAEMRGLLTSLLQKEFNNAVLCDKLKKLLEDITIAK